jgi:4-carboxymuconolactone decarboxylase
VHSFTIMDTKGWFTGPFGIMLEIPSIGYHFFETAKSLGTIPSLPVQARETAILAVGSHFGAEYGLYAHEKLFEKTGMPHNEIQALIQGCLPHESSDNPSRVAFKVASALVKQPGPLESGLWDEAVDAFGHIGAVSLMHFVGFYAYTYILLNALSKADFRILVKPMAAEAGRIGVCLVCRLRDQTQMMGGPAAL